MRVCAGFLGVCILFTLAEPAHAQIAASVFSQKSTTAMSGTPSFFGSLSRPDYSSVMTKPSFPAPIKLSSFFPSFPNLRDTLLMRNTSTSPTLVITPQAPPPPPKKK